MQTISVLSCATRGRIDREAARSTGPPRFRYRYGESDGSSAHGSCRPKDITAAWQLSDSGNGERHTAVSAAREHPVIWARNPSFSVPLA
jgi:hypothetical protein